MSAFDRFKAAGSRLVDSGRRRAQELRNDRARNRLIAELGESYYRYRTGEDELRSELDALVERIRSLATDGDPDGTEIDLRTDEADRLDVDRTDTTDAR